MIDKKDLFYYAKFNGIPVYFQPEENEIVGRNRFCEFLLIITAPFERFFISEKGFKIVIEHRTITRHELKNRGLVE